MKNADSTLQLGSPSIQTLTSDLECICRARIDRRRRRDPPWSQRDFGQRHPHLYPEQSDDHLPRRRNV